MWTSLICLATRLRLKNGDLDMTPDEFSAREFNSSQAKTAVFEPNTAFTCLLFCRLQEHVAGVRGGLCCPGNVGASTSKVISSPKVAESFESLLTVAMGLGGEG